MNQIPLEEHISDNLGEPSDYLKQNVVLYDLNELPEQMRNDLEQSITQQRFVKNHVGGHGTNSPRRGVAVFGNSLLDNTSRIPFTHWTASMNASNITLTTKTTPLPNGVRNITPLLQQLTAEHFPETPITTATYCLGVANCYDADSDHTICSHTDAQAWYADPCPVFASITYYPDGMPESAEHCHRFQILDPAEDKPSWRFLHLKHNMLCIMRSDIYHRVIPPIKKYRNKNLGRKRINVTLRNLVHPSTNPLGYYQAVSNHFRYYGTPYKITMPNNTVIEDHIKLFTNYLKVAMQTGSYNEFKFIKKTEDSSKLQEYHRYLKSKIVDYYKSHKLSDVDLKCILPKPNLVVQTTEEVCKYLQIVI